MDIFLKGLKGSCREYYERLIQLHERTDHEIEFKAVWSKDPERLERAKRFERNHGTNIDFLTSAEDFYEKAEESPESLVVDPYTWLETTEASRHRVKHVRTVPKHIVRKGEFSSGTHEAQQNRYIIENRYDHSSTAIRLKEILKSREVEEVQLYFGSSQGIEKAAKKAEMMHFRGDSLHQKLLEILFFANYLTNKSNPKISKIDSLNFVPRGINSSDLFSFYGGKAENIENAMIGTADLSFEENGIQFETELSMMGATDPMYDVETKLQKKFDESPINESVVQVGNRSIARKENMQIAKIKTDTTYVADLLNDRLYDLGSSRKITTPRTEFQADIHSLADIIRQESGLKKRIPRRETTSLLLDSRYEVRDQIDFSELDYHDKLEEGQEILKENYLIEETQF